MVARFRHRYTTVFRCQDAASGEARVLKCYHRAAMQPRHFANYEGEAAAMRACTAKRSAPEAERQGRQATV